MSNFTWPPTVGGGGGSSTTSDRITTMEADDCVVDITWLDQGAADERPSVITYTSASTGFTVTKTFAYVGSAGSYSIDTITWSIA
jgi:hypothetical protein